MTVLDAALSVVMMTSSLGVKLVGLPRQLAANRRRGTASHALRWYAVLALASYASTALHTLLRGDWETAVNNAAGAVTITLLLWQVLRYPDAG